MEKINSFNLRVYGILVHNDAILLLKESYAGKKLEKFPGGGVEYGEGLKEALVREFQEELGLKVTAIEHFYTQDFFVASIFHSNEQIQTFYYFVQVEEIKKLQKLDDIDELLWIPIANLPHHPMNLPVDKVVMQKLADYFS